MKAKGHTLPEVLVTMLIGGILLLCLFDGIDMVRAVAGQNPDLEMMTNINRLEEYELLKEKSDSLAIGDSIRFFMHGTQIGIIGYLPEWNEKRIQ